MDTSNHTIETLFQQLGLSFNSESIEAFICNNRLPLDVPLERAAFWTAGQAQFIHEAIELDSDWSEVVD